MKLFAFLSFLFTIIACTPPTNTVKDSGGYNFRQPDKIYYLADTLNEISGLDILDSNTVVCIQDENGILFFFSLAENKIIKQTPFFSHGDYEDIALVDSNAFVLRSDGTLFKVTNFNSKNIKTVQLHTPITAKNNEGLFYDKTLKSLLILSKSKPSKNKKLVRDIYQFNFKTNKLENKPIISLHQDSILKFAQEKKLVLGLPPNSNYKLKPSALAFHPINKNLYVLDAENFMLYILTPKGKIIFAENLPKNLFTQAEGIAFFDNGDVLISNEMGGSPANILLYKYHNLQ